MQKVFVLGDSRTGTLSLSNFFAACGLESIHHYEQQANQLEHSPENRTENFRRIKEFIERSTYRAFSDYPTRLYYEELAREYPDAFFILTVRKDLETWKRSMINFFSRFFISLDIEEKAIVHVELNNSIRNFFATTPSIKFLEICIDEDSKKNTVLLKNFLGIDSSLQLGWDNKSSDIDNNLISGRCRLLSVDGTEHVARQVQLSRPNSRGVLSEFGWIFLINDTNRFMDWLYGELSWTDLQRQRAEFTLRKRIDILTELGTQYYKVIIPEKAVVYEEFLPKVFSESSISQSRPAKYLQDAFTNSVAYLDDYLIDAKSYGQLYFRGDTHTTWLGAYFIYQFTLKALRQFLGDRLAPPIPLNKLKPILAGYDGDVFSQIAIGDSERLLDQWKDVQFFGTFEHCIQYELPVETRRARRVEVSASISAEDSARPIFATEVDDASLPSAVIFRDSTAEHLIDLVAEHFRRAVFVWHKGEVIYDIVAMEKPDIVIQMMAERFVCSYGDTMMPTAGNSQLSPTSL